MRIPLSILREGLLDDIERSHWDAVAKKLRESKFDTSARKEFRAALENVWYTAVGVGVNLSQPDVDAKEEK